MRSIYISGLFAYAAISSLFPIISPYAHTLGSSESISALIAGAYALTTSIAMIPFGFLSDRYGREFFLFSGLSICTLMAILYTLAMNPFQLLAVRLLHGFAIAMYIPAVNALVADISKRRGEAIGYLSAFLMFGFVIGPFLSGIIAEEFGILQVFYLSAVLSLISTLLPLKLLTKKKLSSSPLFESRLGFNRTLVRAITATFFASFGSAAIVLFAIPFYSSKLGITKAEVGIATSLLFLLSAISRIPAGILSDKVGRTAVILIGLSIEGFSIALTLTNDPIQLFTAMSACGIGMGFANTASFALASDLKNRGFAMGAVNSFLNAGIFFGSALTGYLAEFLGFQSVFYVASVLTLLSALAVALIKEGD